MRGGVGALVLGGALALTACGGDDRESGPAALTPAPSGTATSAAVEALSGDNLIRERAYFDVTGHSFTRKSLDPNQVLGPCTGASTFADVLPVRGVTMIGSTLVGDEDGLHVTSQLAQIGAAREAKSAAESVVALVDECAAISGGDFGYGEPVTVVAAAERNVVYFPAYDSDREFGGYVVFAVGSRVGVVEVVDAVGADLMAHLAKHAATIAAV